jgi:hypothetical protein
MNGGREFRGECCVVELKCEVLGDFGSLERVQRDAFAKSADREILLKADRRWICRSDGSTLGRHDEHPGGFAPSREGRDHIQRREIRPVHVFEHDDQNPIGSDGFEHLADLAHHPLARRPDRFALQRVALVGLDERGKLQEPGRRTLSQQLKQSLVVRSPDQLIDRFEHWIVRLLSAERLDALASPDPDVRPQRHASLEQIDERRLAHSRFPRDEHHLAHSALGLLETRLELRAGGPPVD